MKKSINELVTEQSIVILLLIVHLCGFMNISPQFVNHKNENFTSYNKYYKNLEEDQNDVSVVIMVVDALRMDHLISSHHFMMRYSKELLSKGKGLGYALKTAAPTVTLPRIKSVVTGSISSFMDVIFNFASYKLKEENLVHLWKQRGNILHFHGDDTWLRLFPVEFSVRNGVPSFFVSDYTQVDNNVTRHLTAEYLRSGWDMLILHYIGLDHIGHLEGPQSKLIEPKLKEMDRIINKIHGHLKEKERPYVFLVCGDHGMSDVGGHGGATHSEIWTSAFIMSHLLDKLEPSPFAKNYSLHREELHNQVDIAPTLAALTGIAIPSGNIGRFFVKIINKMPLKQQLIAHHKLTEQLMNKAHNSPYLSEFDEIINLYFEIVKLHKERLWNKPLDSIQINEDVRNLIKLYEKFELLASTSLIDSLHSYDVPLLVIACSLLTMITLISVCSTLCVSKRNTNFGQDRNKLLVILIFFITLFAFSYLTGSKYIKKSTLLVFPTLLYVIIKFKEFYHSSLLSNWTKGFDDSLIQKAIFLGLLLHPLTLLSTSMVEEEHFTYYFSLSTVYFLLFYGLIRSFVRRINHIDSESDSSDSSENYFSDDFNMQDSTRNYPALYNLNIKLWNYFDLIWKMLFYYRFYDKAKNKHLFLRFMPIIVIIFISGALFRAGRAFNSTGDKWIMLPDINDFIKHSDSQIFNAFIIAGILIIFFLYCSYNIPLVSISLLCIMSRHFPVFANDMNSGATESQIAYGAIGVLFLYGVIKFTWEFNKKPDDFLDFRTDLLVKFLLYLESTISFLFILIQSPENIFVTSLLILHYHCILPLLLINRCDIGLSKWNVYVLVLWIAQAHFFMQGNSNSLSSVQINAGFVGITSYRPIIHGILIALHTFGSRILVLLHFLIVNICHERKPKSCCDILWVWWCIQLFTITVYVINVTAQRYHLFIWSVFAPKLLFEESHLLCLVILTLVTSLYLLKVNKN